MTDLTKITTPFGLLDGETQQVLRSYEGGIEKYLGSGWWAEVFPKWVPYMTYRATLPVKPSINWDHVSPTLNYLARDRGGGLFLYREAPEQGHFFDGWQVCGGARYSAATFVSLNPGICDWRDSLVKRPDS